MLAASVGCQRQAAGGLAGWKPFSALKAVLGAEAMWAPVGETEARESAELRVLSNAGDVGLS